MQPDVEDAWGGEGNDTLIGNNVPNLLNGGPGADVLSGGGDEDFADYSERTEGVTISADGTPNSGNAADGALASRDILATDIEHLFGGDGSDRLTGNASANFLDAGPGDDVLDSRDQGADDNVCGLGVDTASVDLLDLYDDDCERVLLPVPLVGPSSSPQPGAPQPTAPLAVALQLPRGQRFRSMLFTGLRVRATCTSACALRAGALLSAGAAEELRLGSGRRSVRVAGGRGELDRAGSEIVTLRFTRRAKARLPRLRSTRLTIRITATHGSAATTLERRLVVTRKRARLLSVPAAALVRRTDAPPRMMRGSRRP